MFGFEEVDGEPFFTSISTGALGSYHNTFKENILAIHQDFQVQIQDTFQPLTRTQTAVFQVFRRQVHLVRR